MDSPLKRAERVVGTVDGLSIRLAELEAENRRLRREVTTQRELRGNSEVFQQLIENVHEVLWLTDWVERRELYVSKSYETIWGLSCESQYQNVSSWTDSIHPDDRARVREAWRRDAESGSYEQEYRILHKDGTIRWIYDRAFPIRDARGRIYRMAGISEDVTKRKEAEALLRRAHDELEAGVRKRTAELTVANERAQSREAALRRIVEGTSQVGLEFFRTLVQQLAAALGVRFVFVSELIVPGGSRVGLRACWRDDHHVEPFDYNLRGKPCEAVLAGKTCLYPAGVRAQFPQDQWLQEEHIESYLAIPLCDATGTVVGHLGVADGQPMEDIALAQSILQLCAVRVVAELGREHAERDQARLREQLYHAEKMKAVGELAGGVAHDFNNLLTLMFAGIDDVEKCLPDSDTARSAVGLIRQAAREAEEATQALISVSRPGLAGRDALDLTALIAELTHLIRAMLPAGVVTHFVNDLGIPFWIDGNGSHIRRVIMNMVSNSRDAMSGGGQLTVALQPADGGVCQRCGVDAARPHVAVAISDTGQGIPGHVLPRVCEPFFTTKIRTKGTGLGLAIAHRIVRDHDGGMDIQSDEARGTTVTMVLPLIPAPEADGRPAHSAATPVVGHGVLLLAEDNVQVERLIAAALRDHGYDISSVADGQAALQRYGELRGHCRAVILDIDLPGCTGLECLERIRADDRDTAVILITGQAPPELSEELDDRTVLLPKPFRMTQLAQLVDELIASP